MKNYLSILIAVFLLAGTACPQKSRASNKEKAEKEVTAVLDKIHAAWNAKDVDTYFKLLSDDGLYCGTDRKEFWDKNSLKEMMSQTFSNPNVQMKYDIDKRLIRVSADGRSALVIEQYTMDEMFSPKLPIRFTTHHIKTKKGWIIDYVGWSIIPDNDDVPKLVKALAQ